MSLSLGARYMSISELKDALPQVRQAFDTSVRGGSNADVIAWLRLPRTIAGLVVGAALGIAGAMVQGHTRNVLADPGILGVSAGASFALMLWAFFLGVPSPLMVSFVAFLGAAGATAIVFGIGSIGRGLNDPITLIMGGAVLAAFLSTATTALSIMKTEVLEQLRFLGVGALSRVNYESLAIFGPILLIGILLGLATAPSLNLLVMGDDVAAGLGVNVLRSRVIGMAVFSILTGTATALVGPIGFIGLVVPHLARNIVSTDYRWILPLSGLSGALLLLLADVLGRVVLRPQEVQVHLVLVFIGVPFFIYVIRRRKSLVKL
ncbi:iron complex transport system permease protein [Corynebacterium spheniscorum]|uniref:Iron complex transport system permease protein n=2 Tax=Corynebacterium spheniscorum TaxID=185761 RepID=A0A1I2VCR5_9CORY|nr:iron chelate uptake ABC transporter family permease subunit [Corynebacterium spheniscorum]KAA8720267.1 iron chelate uptake ABC transporter family permease subunit [Corynebacterium spheniscorum]SFG86950.1 iron complex transport system permease protein [Corynebacterium spheniscorum]